MQPQSDNPAVLISSGNTRLAVSVLIQNNQIERARQVVKNSKDAQAHVILGNAYLSKGQYDQARVEYRTAIKLEPQNKEARSQGVGLLLFLAAQQVKEKAWEKALGLLREAVEIDPANSTLQRYQLSIDAMSVMQGLSIDHLDRVIPVLEERQSKEPARGDLAHLIAMLAHRQAIELQEKADFQASEAAWKLAIANWGVVIEADEYWRKWATARQAVYAIDDKPIASEELDKMRRQTIKENIREVHQQYVQLYTQAGQVDIARSHRRLRGLWTLELATARSLHDTRDFLTGRGKKPVLPVVCGPLMWDRLGMKDKVKSLAQEALKLDSSYKPAKDLLDALSAIGLGRVFLNEGQLDEAIAALEEYLKANPKDPAARAMIAQALLDKSQTLPQTGWKEALDLAKRAKQYGATEEQCQEYIGKVVLNRIRELEGKDDQIEQVLRQALAQSPGNRLLKDRYADLVVSRTTKYIEKELAGSPDVDRIVTIFGRAETMFADADKVAGPNHPTIQKQMRDLREVHAKALNSMAVDLFNKAAQNVQYNRYSACEQLKQAERLCEQAKQLDPSNRTVQENLEQVRRAKTMLNCY